MSLLLSLLKYLERVARIELAQPGRKHGILPLNYTRITFIFDYIIFFSKSLHSNIIYSNLLILCKTIDYFIILIYNVYINMYWRVRQNEKRISSCSYSKRDWRVFLCYQRRKHRTASVPCNRLLSQRQLLQMHKRV